MPNSTHSTVLAADVFRLSHSAAIDDSDVIRVQNCDHWTRSSTATSGSTMNAPPAIAGTKIHRATRIRFPSGPRFA